MRYLLLVLYFFSAVSFANHCSGEHNDADRTADHDHAEETKESVKMEKDSKEESSEVMEDSEKDA